MLDIDYADRFRCRFPPSTSKAESPQPDLQILFHGETADLPAGSQATLNLLIEQIKRGNISLITIHAFAALADRPSWAAQRLALTRALAVRDYLVQKAVPTRQIILKPIGNICAAPCQRVDIFLTKK